MIFNLSSSITCLLKGKHITLTKTLLRTIFELVECENQIFIHKAHPTLEGYSPSLACRRVTCKNFEKPIRLSANQLSVPCKVLQNIIALVILPWKIIGMKLIKSISLFLIPFWLYRNWIFQPLNLDIWNLFIPRYTSKPYLTLCYWLKSLKYFDVSLNGEIFLSLHPVDIINIQTLKRMENLQGASSMGGSY